MAWKLKEQTVFNGRIVRKYLIILAFIVIFQIDPLENIQINKLLVDYDFGEV